MDVYEEIQAYNFDDFVVILWYFGAIDIIRLIIAIAIIVIVDNCDHLIVAQSVLLFQKFLVVREFIPGSWISWRLG